MNMPTPFLRRFDTVQSILLRMAGDRLPKETSGAWMVNDGLLSEPEERLKRMPIDGIVYHVLKGQIEYDFELPRVEEIAAEIRRASVPAGNGLSAAGRGAIAYPHGSVL